MLLLQATSVFFRTSSILQLLLLIILVIVVIIAIRRRPATIVDRWQTFLDGQSIGAHDFYSTVKAGLLERQITKVSVKEQTFLESHIASAKRLYLRISQNEYDYYVCAAPYGTGTFISSWLCVKDEQLVNRLPVVSKLMGKDRKNKTFYQRDTEAMFRLAVHTTVISAVDNLSEEHGQRGLTDLQKLRTTP